MNKQNRNNMSSVFGIAVVSKIEKTAERSFKLLCVDEGQPLDSKPTRAIISNIEYPIGSRLYWEHWYRTGESVVMPMPNKDCSLVSL